MREYDDFKLITSLETHKILEILKNKKHTQKCCKKIMVLNKILILFANQRNYLALYKNFFYINNLVKMPLIFNNIDNKGE